jgi:hypothetical protein
MLLLGVIGAGIEAIRSQQLQYVCEKCEYSWDV